MQPEEMITKGEEPSDTNKKIARGQRLQNLKDKTSFLSTVLLFLLAPAIALGVTAFLYQSYEVDGESMETTLQNHDRLIVDKTSRSWSKVTKHQFVPHRGSIIIFNQQGLIDANGNEEKQLIKRVIGLPGERVVIKDDSITIFNTQHPEGFNPDVTTGYHITATKTAGYIDTVIGNNQIYVCGDNRGNSLDSRSFGPIRTDQIVGKLSIRILPIDKVEKFLDY